jgi:hypothetical protein
LFQDIQDDNEIHVDVCKEAVLAFLQFLYTGKLAADSKDVLSLANRYSPHSLTILFSALLIILKQVGRDSTPRVSARKSTYASCNHKR